MHRKRAQPSIFGELKNAIAYVFGQYKPLEFSGNDDTYKLERPWVETMMIHKNIHQDFSDKLDSLLVLAKLKGYEVNVNAYDLYQKNGKIRDSRRYRYRITWPGHINAGVHMELVFNARLKTLRRITTSEIGQKYFGSDFSTHVKTQKDIECIDEIIKLL
jgi:hypothetical protein